MTRSKVQKQHQSSASRQDIPASFLSTKQQPILSMSLKQVYFMGFNLLHHPLGLREIEES